MARGNARSTKDILHLLDHLSFQQETGPKQPPLEWSAKEDDLLRKFGRTLNDQQLAELIGRSERACNKRRLKLGITTRTINRWTEQEIVTLREGYATKPPAVIAAELGRSLDAVWHKGRELGLSALPAARRGWSGNTWPRGKDFPEILISNPHLYDDCLRELSVHLTNPQIQAHLGVTRGWLTRRMKKLEIKRDPALVAKRRAANLGADQPPEVRELMQLRTQLIRKIHAKSKNNRNATRAPLQAARVA